MRGLSESSVLPGNMVGGSKGERPKTGPEGSCIEVCDLAVGVIEFHFHHILGSL